MLKISTKSQYGLRAMVYLAKKKKVCSLREVSKEEGIPFDYLEKIFSSLEKSDLVSAKKGVHGGYYLAKRPSLIKIGEIIKALEKKIFFVKCISWGKSKCLCPRENDCLTKSFWAKIYATLESALNSITLADLIHEK